MSRDSGRLSGSREPSPSGLGPSGFDPERKVCDLCGAKPVRAIVEGRALCDEHRMEWLREESASASEAQVLRVGMALDAVMDEDIGDDWDGHIRKLALAAIGAM